jgi:hypothetical protein
VRSTASATTRAANAAAAAAAGTFCCPTINNDNNFYCNSVALLQAGLRALERLKGAELLTPVYMMLIPACFYAVLHCTGTTSDQVLARMQQLSVCSCSACSCCKVQSVSVNDCADCGCSVVKEVVIHCVFMLEHAHYLVQLVRPSEAFHVSYL